MSFSNTISNDPYVRSPVVPNNVELRRGEHLAELSADHVAIRRHARSQTQEDKRAHAGYARYATNHAHDVGGGQAYLSSGYDVHSIEHLTKRDPNQERH